MSLFPLPRTMVSSLLTFAVIGSHNAQGQTNPGITALESIQVQGDATAGALLPGSTRLDRESLQKRVITSWDDLTRRAEPGIQFNPTNNSLNIRGMDADRVVTRIDGVRIPWLADGARGVEGGLDTVAFSSLSSIEVARGAGAIRSGAPTGFIDLQTLSPEDVLRPGRDLGARFHAGHDSADHSWRGDVSVAGRASGATSWLLHLGIKHGDERRNFDGRGGYGPDRTRLNPQDDRQTDLLAKVHHEVTPEHRLELTGEHFRRRTDLDNRRAQGPGTSFESGYNTTRQTTERDRIVLGYRFKSAHEASLVDQAYVKAYWQRMRLSSRQDARRVADERGRIIPGDPFQYGYPFGAFQRDNRIQESGAGIVSQWEGRWQTGALQHRWMMGADGYASWTRQASDGRDNCPDAVPGLPAPFGPRSCDLLHTGQADMPKVKGTSWAVWAQDEIAWRDGRFSITPGLRMDAYRYQPREGGNYQDNPNAGVTSLASNHGSRLSPSATIRYQPATNIQFYATYAYGFKAPNASQLYLNYGAPGTYLSVGNPDLKPETSQGLELGLEMGDADLNGRISVFHNRYKNFIDTDYAVAPGDPAWNPAWDGLYPMGVTTAINRARVRIYGVEASGTWQMTPHWYGRAALVWARGRDMDAGTALNSVAPMKFSTALGYETPVWGAEASFTAATRHKRVEHENDFRAPGFGVTDLTAWWTPPTISGLRLYAGLYNVFDKKYWEALNVPRGGRDVAPVDYYTESGRSVRLGFSYQY